MVITQSSYERLLNSNQTYLLFPTDKVQLTVKILRLLRVLCLSLTYQEF